MEKFLPENCPIAQTSDLSRFGSLGPATGLGKQSPGSACQLFRVLRFWRARRGDDDLGPVTDRTSRVEGCAVTASSRGVRGCPSTSDIPSTPAPFGPSIYYDPGALGSFHSATPIPFRTRPPTTLHHLYTSIPYDPYGYSQPPYTSYDLYAHAHSLPLRILGETLRVDTKELSGCWSLLEAWIYLYFPMFSLAVRSGAKLCKPYIQSFAMLGHKLEHKLIDLQNYMPWFLPRTHPRIQNPQRLPHSVQLPTATPITPQVLVDMISREVDRDDVDDATKIGRISDMIKKYNQPRR
ncbi:hypothetical protein M9H77_17806 [Catharanthus roseus]|uniref:Uncharacterized protein n=1 Tax=Catharanthus roseus TaxID=4058 RepID=A0ACC0B5M9_CATRO|nr:hypothetical protein M9H77_17806 [Catharanthus roseus]